MTHAGRCLCGTLRYEIDGPLVAMMHCHCSMCRKHHGAAFATLVTAQRGALRWTAGASAVRHYESSPGIQRAFCGICGSVAPVERAGILIIPAGNLETDPGLRPASHQFTASKAGWYDITDDLPQDPGKDDSPVDEKSPPQSGGAASGSCLCGEVAYEISGSAMRMFYCHCSRCRRARSAAHAANVFYSLEGFSWLRGADRVQDYHYPEAKLFGVAFCNRCGGAVPRASVERGIVSVPAGSLDTDPGIAVTGRIYVDSKAPWDMISDSIERFSEGPPAR